MKHCLFAAINGFANRNPVRLFCLQYLLGRNVNKRTVQLAVRFQGFKPLLCICERAMIPCVYACRLYASAREVLQTLPVAPGVGADRLNYALSLGPPWLVVLSLLVNTACGSISHMITTTG